MPPNKDSSAESHSTIYYGITIVAAELKSAPDKKASNFYQTPFLARVAIFKYCILTVEANSNRRLYRDDL